MYKERGYLIFTSTLSVTELRKRQRGWKHKEWGKKTIYKQILEDAV